MLLGEQLLRVECIQLRDCIEAVLREIFEETLVLVDQHRQLLCTVQIMFSIASMLADDTFTACPPSNCPNTARCMRVCT
jgi:hypothetical protein